MDLGPSGARFERDRWSNRIVISGLLLGGWNPAISVKTLGNWCRVRGDFSSMNKEPVGTVDDWFGYSSGERAEDRPMGNLLA
jgi:hypothetical protein